MKKYTNFYLQSIRMALAYKVEFFLQIFSTSLEAVIMVFLWKKIFESSSNTAIGNFSINEMILYILLTFTVGKALSSSVDWEISHEIRDGTIAMELIKPYSYILRHLFSDLGRTTIGSLGSIFLLIIALFFVDASKITLVNSLIFIFSMLVAYILTFAINMLVSLSSFHTTYMWGVLMFKGAVLSFLSGQLIPITFFPKSIEAVMKYLPFGYTSFYPIYILMGKLTPREISYALLIQITWAIVLIVLMRSFYRKSLNRLQIAGG